MEQQIDSKLFELSYQRYSIFELQDVDNGNFDVTFVFSDETELHVHSFILWSASEVFKTMLKDTWKKSKAIPITGHSNKDFKELLTFLYLGQCKIDIGNVMEIVDLAECYDIEPLIDVCDDFLSNIEYSPNNVNNIFQAIELYSLKKARKNIFQYIGYNTTTLLISKDFLEYDKNLILTIVQLNILSAKEEDLFEAILKWAEYQFSNQTRKSNYGNWIKAELSEILRYIRFPIMNVEFLHKFVVPKGHLFLTFDELSKILCDADACEKGILKTPSSKYCNKFRNTSIEFIDSQGNKGFVFLTNNTLIQALKKYKNEKIMQIASQPYDNLSCYWNIDIPDTCSTVVLPTTATNTNYYLIRNISTGKIGLTNSTPAQNRDPYSYSPSPKYIAKVYLENDNFTIRQGCNLRINTN